MTVRGIAVLALAASLAACTTGTMGSSDAPPSSPAASGGGAEVDVEESPEPSIAAEPEETNAPEPEIDPTGCIPGTWTTDMPSLVSTFQTEGDPTYQSGAFTFTFTENFLYSAEAKHVFRLTAPDGFVDVTNAWTEDGLWAVANEDTSFDQVLVIQGARIQGDAQRMMDEFGLEDESTLVLIEGQDYKPGDNYAMVNGAIRTPLSNDQATSISAIGTVDCAEGTMQVLVDDAGWSGIFQLNRTP